VKAPFGCVQNEVYLADIGNELRILRRIRHPNIILCHGAVIEPSWGEVALVLELVRGQSMSDFISGEGRGGQHPSSHAQCQCLLGICHALLYLHSCTPCVVHGDLKPSNVMIQRLIGSPDEKEVVHAKLLDFGLARVLTRQAKPLGGTARWKAPELISMPSTKPSKAADVYSFGCLLFCIVSGKQPMQELDAEEIKALQRRKSRPSLQWPSDAPSLGNCRVMVERTTMVEPKARPSMRHIHDELVLWPEIRQADAHNCGAIAGMEGNESAIFWQKIRRFRSAILRQDPMAASQPSTRRATKEQTLLVRPDAAPAACAQHLAATSGALQLRYANLAETHAHSLNLRVLGIVKRSNFRLSHASCCIHHAAVEALGRVHIALAMQSCQQRLEADRKQLMAQCPQCTMMEQVGDITEVDDFECAICGFSGTPVLNAAAEGPSKQETDLNRLTGDQEHVLLSAPLHGAGTTSVRL